MVSITSFVWFCLNDCSVSNKMQMRPKSVFSEACRFSASQYLWKQNSKNDVVNVVYMLLRKALLINKWPDRSPNYHKIARTFSQNCSSPSFNVSNWTANKWFTNAWTKVILTYRVRWKAVTSCFERLAMTDLTPKNKKNKKNKSPLRKWLTSRSAKFQVMFGKRRFIHTYKIKKHRINELLN